MNDAEVEVDDLRIRAIRPLVPSACLIEDVPADAAVYETVGAARTAVELAIRGEDDRLVVIVGPASIHDRAAVLEFAQRLHEAATKLSRELIVVLRAFMDKPAGSAWSGMINDPDLDGSFQINKGFKQARQLLVEVVRLGLPVACEYLDTISPQFVADLISLNTTDSRTSESRLHRELASGLSTPVGFRNGNSGDSSAAIEAVNASAGPHAFLSVSKQGVAGIVETSGNRDCHVVLHGGTSGPNHSEDAVRGVCDSLAALQLPARVMVDCGSYNARQSPSVQAEVAESMAARIAQGDTQVFGLVLHSFLVSGRQDLVSGGAPIYGMSVTEPCMDWSATASVLEKLAAAVRQRRNLAGAAQTGRKKQRSS